MSYVSEQLEFSDGPYVNEEDDEKEELAFLRDGNSYKDRGSQSSLAALFSERTKKAYVKIFSDRRETKCGTELCQKSVSL